MREAAKLRDMRRLVARGAITTLRAGRAGGDRGPGPGRVDAARYELSLRTWRPFRRYRRPDRSQQKGPWSTAATYCFIWTNWPDCGSIWRCPALPLPPQTRHDGDGPPARPGRIKPSLACWGLSTVASPTRARTSRRGSSSPIPAVSCGMLMNVDLPACPEDDLIPAIGGYAGASLRLPPGSGWPGEAHPGGTRRYPRRGRLGHQGLNVGDRIAVEGWSTCVTAPWFVI